MTSSRILTSLLTCLLLLVGITACARPPADVENNPIVVGAVEDQTLEAVAELYAQQLEAAEIPVIRLFHLPDRETAWENMVDGTIDVMADYALPLRDFLLTQGSDLTAPFDVYAQILEVAPDTVVVGRQSKAMVDGSTIIPLSSLRLNARQQSLLEDVSLKLTDQELLRIQGLMNTAQLTPRQAARRWLIDVGLIPPGTPLPAEVATN